MLDDHLRFLGLSNEEINIYLTLLQRGTMPVARIAQRAKIGRINCYHHLEKLLEKGFIIQTKLPN